MKPLVCDLPYPTLDNLEPDTKSGQILSFAYATPKGELTAVLQYLNHQVHLSFLHPEDAETLMSLALAEMHHLHILGKALKKLGINPQYVRYPHSRVYYDTAAVSQATTPQKMLLDDIQSEMNTIAEYNKMLFVLKNENVAAIIQRIVMDEQLHLETLKILMEKYSR